MGLVIRQGSDHPKISRCVSARLRAVSRAETRHEEDAPSRPKRDGTQKKTNRQHLALCCMCSFNPDTIKFSAQRRSKTKTILVPCTISVHGLDSEGNPRRTLVSHRETERDCIVRRPYKYMLTPSPQKNIYTSGTYFHAHENAATACRRTQPSLLAQCKCQQEAPVAAKRHDTTGVVLRS